MKILDLLFYYLTIYFEAHKEKLKWSTPLERAIYVVGIVSILWLCSIWEVFELITTKSIPFKNIKETPFVILGAIVGYGIMEFYKYIYITKNRYNRITSSSNFKSIISVRTGKNLAIIFVMISFVLPFAIFMIFTS